MLAAFDSPGPLTTHPITASCQLLDAVVPLLPVGHLLADVGLRPFGQLLERAAGRPAASGAGGDAWRERAEAERLEDFARGVHLVASIAARTRRQRHADRVADPLVQQDPDRDRRPDQALGAHPGFGQAEVERLARLRREIAIDRDQRLRARDLARDDDLVLSQSALERKVRRLQRREHHALVDDVLRRLAVVAIGVLLHLRHHQLLVEGAAVDADAHRLAVVRRRPCRSSRTARRAACRCRRCRD